MKLNLEDLTKVIKPTAETIKTIEPLGTDVPIMESISSNIKQMMGVLESVGIKDLFIEKAKTEIRKRFFGEDDKGGDSTDMTKPTINIEKVLTLAFVWLDTFIEKNGDMPLTEFREALEAEKPKLIQMIKSVGL